MYLFILGVILGIGLATAIRSIDRTVRLRRYRKMEAMEQEIQRRVTEAVQRELNPWDSDGWMGPRPNGKFVPIRHP